MGEVLNPIPPQWRQQPSEAMARGDALLERVGILLEPCGNDLADLPTVRIAVHSSGLPILFLTTGMAGTISLLSDCSGHPLLI